MVDMYKIIEFLCKRRGISIAQMCRDTGLRQGLISDLKHGRTQKLSYQNMFTIANYFQISMDVFNEGVFDETIPNEADYACIIGLKRPEKENAPALTEKDRRDVAKDVERMMSDLENSGDLMFDGVPISPEARESLAAAMKLGLEAARLKNKEKYTPKKYRK